MSSKTSILLTSDNEHWYLEANAEYYEETKTKEAIVLEIGKQHKVEITDENTRIIIEEGTDLFRQIADLYSHKRLFRILQRMKN